MLDAFDVFGRTVDRLERQLWAASWLGIILRGLIVGAAVGFLILAITRGQPW